MNRIHVLPEIVANKIAAGEVVERPASIIKELIENALDAGATRIEVQMEHGGKSLIRVSDNGCGMSRADAALAFQRHATSKIETAEDLERIASFGFRGEALPSIAAVARVRLRTRRHGDDGGTELLIAGGHLQGVDSCACREGSIIEIKDLFYNTPARRKFLRTDATERSHILTTVANFALAANHVHFRLQSGDRQIWDFKSGEALTHRAQIAFGLAHPTDLLAFSDEDGGIRVSGLIGKPQVARANRSGQVLFVNRRMVRALSLSYALLEACHGLLMHGQYPVGIVFVDVAPDQVDVNVHPTKQEVRLSREKEIKGLLKRAIQSRLAQEEDMAPFLKLGSRPGGGNERTRVPLAPHQQAWTPREIPTFNRPERPSSLAAPISLRNKLRVTKIMGQLHQTYIVAETETGFILIDQHAAHERVIFEGLLEGFRSKQPRKQGLLLNEVLVLRPQQEAVFKAHQSALAKLGFELDAFGEHEYVIRTVPALLADADPVASLQGFLDQKEAGQAMTDLEQHPEALAALIACKCRSVKAHDPLSPEGMQSLLERLARCENPFNCPHGRPALFQMSLAELDKQFKRTL